MSATLKILNSFEMAAQGRTFTGKQGPAIGAVDDTFDVTMTGLVHERIGTLATAAIATPYDSSNDLPATFSYLYLWADQDIYIQIIGSASHAIFKVDATNPFIMPGFGSVLGAANTTAIAGGSEPTVTAVGKIVLGNYSGNTANYHLGIIL